MHAGIVNWRFPLKSVVGKTLPAFPAHTQPAILRIWQEAHRILVYSVISRASITKLDASYCVAWRRYINSINYCPCDFILKPLFHPCILLISSKTSPKYIMLMTNSLGYDFRKVLFQGTILAVGDCVSLVFMPDVPGSMWRSWLYHFRMFVCKK